MTITVDGVALDTESLSALCLDRNEMFLGWRSRWMTDGLSDAAGMNYTRVLLEELPLYTHIKADIGDPPAKMRLGNPDELVSLWW